MTQNINALIQFPPKKYSLIPNKKKLRFTCKKEEERINYHGKKLHQHTCPEAKPASSNG
jgi:hypothetical protein